MSKPHAYLGLLNQLMLYPSYLSDNLLVIWEVVNFI